MLAAASDICAPAQPALAGNAGTLGDSLGVRVRDYFLPLATPAIESSQPRSVSRLTVRSCWRWKSKPYFLEPLKPVSTDRTGIPRSKAISLVQSPLFRNDRALWSSSESFTPSFGLEPWLIGLLRISACRKLAATLARAAPVSASRLSGRYGKCRRWRALLVFR